MGGIREGSRTTSRDHVLCRGPQATEKARFFLSVALLCLKQLPWRANRQSILPVKTFIKFPRNSVTFQKLVQIADIPGLLSALQPHPSYFSHA